MRDTQVYKPSGVPIPISIEIVPKCFEIKYQPKDREQKRKFDREVQKCMEQLMSIEMAFTECIFDPMADNFVEDYTQIYKVYNDTFIKRVKWLKQYGKFKFIEPNERYFEQEFKQIEK
jgi:hypothetical protein